MTKFRKKPVEIEVITFDEFVEYGKQNTDNIVNEMPWSFEYKGHNITHANDKCYLIPTLEGTMNFTPDDVLITGVQGEIYPCKIKIFNETYEPIGSYLSFGQAIEALKEGKRVARKGWNGKGMWLHIANGKHHDSYSIDLFSTDYSEVNEVLPSIVMKTADDKILVGWLASQTDILAEDWMIVE